MDSGCEWTLVRENLLREAEVFSEGPMSLMYLYGDMKDYPCVMV